MRQALVETLAAPDMRRAKEALLIKEVVDLPLQSYQSIADLERRALESKYSDVGFNSYYLWNQKYPQSSVRPCVARHSKGKSGSMSNRYRG